MRKPRPQHQKPSICFVAPNNYAVLSGRPDLKHIGGAEIQQPMIAKELLRRGHAVSFVTLDHGQQDGIIHDGLWVFKAYAPGRGIRGLRFFHPRWSGLWRAMGRADADVYYQMNAGSETGQVAAWCWLHKRRFLFAVSSDADCDPSLPNLSHARERLLYRYGLSHTDRVISQTIVQQRMLRDAFKTDSVIIPSCSADPFEGRFSRRRPPEAGVAGALWVGRFSPEKRLELLLDLAELLSDVRFDVVGAAFAESDYSRGLERRAAGLSNVILHGRVPHEDMTTFYRRSSVLVCTSAYEGFPNTFMEAWCHGTPVVTTVDPDNVVSTEGLGQAVDCSGELREVLAGLLGSAQRWTECSVKARRYYDQNHTVQATVDRLGQVVEVHPNDRREQPA